MKQLVCEMCGGTELLKEDGVFVCQSCGTKYSVEEARKMMVEVTGTVQVKNAAQLENLLNLAKSSFESQNYAQAEEFCNQVIAMDDKNYEAWKLKGEAINYQINAKNQRILEVYNCIMTSYRVLSEEEKETKIFDIIFSLKTCLEGEVDFWLKQFEASRPTDSALSRVKNAYIDAYDKMAAAYEELGLKDLLDGYLINLANYFIAKCNGICVDAWNSTVGYNYYRDYMGKGKDPFTRPAKEHRWVIANTDLYRPTYNIWSTFINETDNLIGLLKFAEKQINDDTDSKLISNIYSNIIYFEECLIPSGSWKIMTGYTSSWDEYMSVGWGEEYGLSDEAKRMRRENINKYKEKQNNEPKEAIARQRRKQEKERKEKIKKYWENHPKEKAELDNEYADIKNKIDALNAKIDEINKKNAPQVGELYLERERKLPCEVEVDKQRKLILDLENQRDKCGIFKGKEKKAIQQRIDTEEAPKLKLLQKQAEEKKKSHQERIDSQIMDVNIESKEFRDEVALLQKRADEITTELTKDR